ncbi:MAG: 3-methyl-2-oxobutanoate hydroxymethyltransferase [Brevinematia bacterium]
MLSPRSFLSYKQEGKKISMITCYDYTTSRILAKSKVDIVLVGDSLGMVIYGYPSTLQVDITKMVFHTEAVARGLNGTKFLVSDMPFLSYQSSRRDAVLNAGLLVKAGANAVKVEGGKRVVDRIKAILDADIPVMGHLGLTPQSINVFGGFKLQSTSEKEIEKIFEDALLLEREGCFAIVLELIPEEVAKVISENLKIPTIGIGAGRFCDGQVLVIHDMLGYFVDFKPKHVKRYSNVSDEILNSVNSFVSDVLSGLFPDKDNVFSINEEVDIQAISERVFGKNVF